MAQKDLQGGQDDDEGITDHFVDLDVIDGVEQEEDFEQDFGSDATSNIMQDALDAIQEAEIHADRVEFDSENSWYLKPSEQLGPEPRGGYTPWVVNDKTSKSAGLEPRW